MTGLSNPLEEARPAGEVFDRGYSHYAGRRAGRAHAVGALIGYSIKRGLGIKQRWTAKIIPAALYVVAFLPVIVIVALKAFTRAAGADAPALAYFDLYSLLSLVLLVFAAATGPELLCDDRRERVLDLYFARAISRLDYVLAKIGALGVLVGSIALLPALLLFLGDAFLAASPGQYIGDHLEDLGRVLAAGAVVALFYTSAGLVAPAFIDRKGVASTAAVGGILVVAVILSGLFDAIAADWHRYLVLANPTLIPQGITLWIFGAGPTSNVDPRIVGADLPGELYLLAVGAAALLAGVAVYWRYLAEE